MSTPDKTMSTSRSRTISCRQDTPIRLNPLGVAITALNSQQTSSSMMDNTMNDHYDSSKTAAA